MHRIVLAVALTAAAFLVPALAMGEEGTKGNGLSYCDENYLDLYAEVDPGGPNLVKDGLNGEPAGEDRICRKVDVLYGIKQDELAAEAAAAEAAAAEAAAAEAPAEPTTTTTTTGTSGGYSIPEYIVECESGGSYTASNPSGAYGAYQIMPGTASAYGCDLSTPAGQDACAAEIYSDVGTSAWACG
jgi:transglycosylase-like protein